MSKNTDIDDIYEDDLKVDSRNEVKEPRMYRVIMHNDHYTTMDFVIEVLMKIFHKDTAESTKIMLDIHKREQGTCGVFTYDVALTKISEVHNMARKNEFPLKCSYEDV